MKYLFQMLIIGGITVIGELLNYWIPLPVPASVYGLLLLFLCLCTGLIKLSAIEETADFLLVIMPLLFVSPSVSIMNTYLQVSDSLLSIAVISMLSTVIVMAVTGILSQYLIGLKNNKKNREIKEHE